MGTLENIHPDLRSLAHPIETLSEDPNNANAHNDPNLESIAESFLRFGQLKPIVVRREGMTVTAGNGTLAALTAAGWTHLACVVCDHDVATATAYAIADNLSARLAKWDFDQLRVNVESLLAENYDVLGLGFAADDLADVLAGKAGELAEQFNGDNSSEPDSAQPPPPEQPSEPEPEPPIPEPPAEPITQFGDVIELGPHTLHCADCMDVMAGLPDNSLHAIVVDPSYGLSPDGKARTWDDIAALRAAGKNTPKAGFCGEAWDAGVPGVTWARECLRVLMPGGYLVAFSATRTIHRLACGVEDAGFTIIDQLNWLQWESMPHGANASILIDKAAGAERAVVGENMGTRPRRSAAHKESQSLGAGWHTAAGPNGGMPITAPATDLAKLWDDYHTRLKTCTEPICLAQKPLEGTVVENIKKWGCGALNIGATRHPEGDHSWPGPQCKMTAGTGVQSPPSVALSGGSDGSLNISMSVPHDNGRFPGNVFQYPKPSTREKTVGTDETHKRHKTVKPVAAMRRLLRLVLPPGRARVGEWFGGSGTTLVAAAGLDCEIIAAELDPAHCDIICARVRWALAQP